MDRDLPVREDGRRTRRQLTEEFCACFDSGVLVKGLALYRSPRWYAGRFPLRVLCHDEPTFDVLGSLQLPEVVRVCPGDLEHVDWIQCGGDLSHTERFAEEVLSLLMFLELSGTDVERVVSVLREVAE